MKTIPAHNSQLTGYYMELNKDLFSIREFEEKRLDAQESTLKHCIFDNLEVIKNIKGVIQIGAAYGEQVDLFNKLNIPYQIYFEPVTKAYNTTKEKLIKNYPKVKTLIYNVAIGENNGFMKFFECGPNNSNSSSLLPFSKIATKYNPKLITNHEYDVPVWSLNDFINSPSSIVQNYVKHCNLLYMDVQGYEYYVIKGAEKVINQFDYIYTEVNHIPLYDGTILFKEFNKLMNKNGFILADLTPLIKSTGSQSNALYVRNPLDFSRIKDLSDTVHFNDGMDN
jgi:FkbM family methyltransferase